MANKYPNSTRYISGQPEQGQGKQKAAARGREIDSYNCFPFSRSDIDQYSLVHLPIFHDSTDPQIDDLKVHLTTCSTFRFDASRTHTADTTRTAYHVN